MEQEQQQDQELRTNLKRTPLREGPNFMLDLLLGTITVLKLFKVQSVLILSIYALRRGLMLSLSKISVDLVKPL